MEPMNAAHPNIFHKNMKRRGTNQQYSENEENVWNDEKQSSSKILCVTGSSPKVDKIYWEEIYFPKFLMLTEHQPFLLI